jgi:hypothetical protein
MLVGSTSIAWHNTPGKAILMVLFKSAAITLLKYDAEKYCRFMIAEMGKQSECTLHFHLKCHYNGYNAEQ